MSDLMTFGWPEKTTFGNDTVADSGKNRLEQADVKGRSVFRIRITLDLILTTSSAWPPGRGWLTRHGTLLSAPYPTPKTPALSIPA